MLDKFLISGYIMVIGGLTGFLLALIFHNFSFIYISLGCVMQFILFIAYIFFGPNSEHGTGASLFP